MIRIFSDSTSDLGPELTERYHVTTIPLHILLGEEDFLDGVTISPSEIYKWSDEHKATPKTAAAGLGEVMDAFRPVLLAGDEIIAFSISFDMSSSGQVMKLAAEELGYADKVSVIDSRELSSGVGHEVIEAAIMAEEGFSREEIVERIQALIPRVSASFVVDTLTYLYRGGRCSGVAALAGSLLKLHPEILVTDGKMIPGKKYRGKLMSVVQEYVKSREEELLRAKPDRIFITSSLGCDEENEWTRQYLESLHYFKEIHITGASGVISSHCGPGTLGILYIRGE
jgi:DegV family protein with EDD domain